MIIKAQNRMNERFIGNLMKCRPSPSAGPCDTDSIKTLATATRRQNGRRADVQNGGGARPQSANGKPARHSNVPAGTKMSEFK